MSIVSQPCLYGAGGEYKCGFVENFHSKSDPEADSSPDNYPKCISTGCSAGKPCESQSGCLNGLSCKNGVCTFERRFHSENDPDYDKNHDDNDDKGRFHAANDPHHHEEKEKEDTEDKPWWFRWLSSWFE